MGPLLTFEVHQALRAAALAGRAKVECSLDLGRSTTTVDLSGAGWSLSLPAFFGYQAAVPMPPFSAGTAR